MAQWEKRTFVHLDGDSRIVGAFDVERPYVVSVNPETGEQTEAPPDWSDVTEQPDVYDVTGHPDWTHHSLMQLHVYDPASKTFTPPPPTPVVVSRLEFEQLFTQAERIAIRKRRATGDALADVIDDFYDLLAKADANHVNLGDALVQDGLQLLVDNGLLTAERKVAVLANQPPVAG